MERIDIGEWYLHSLTTNSVTLLNPLDSRGHSVTTEFSLDSNGVYGFSCWICDSMSSAIYYDENQASFTVDNVYKTFGGCEADLEDDDEFIYIGDVQGRFLDFMSQPGDFSYVITDEALTTPKKVRITSANGDVAVYHNSVLSISKNTWTSIAIYPNPVKDYLFLKSTNALKNVTVEIYDILGRSQIFIPFYNAVPIKVQHLPKGVYLLLIKDDAGNTSLGKFVK